MFSTSNPRPSLAAVLQRLTLTLWVGGLWVMGWVMVPLLFASLDRTTAGMVAGKGFAALAWLGLGCGLLWLVMGRLRPTLPAAQHRQSRRVVWGMLACTLVNHFGVTPVIAWLKAQAAQGQLDSVVWGGGFGMWHGISSSIFLLQSLLALGWVVSESRQRT